jgi:subtilase family serine protease
MRMVRILGMSGLIGSTLLTVGGCESVSHSETAVEKRTSAVMLSGTNLDLQVSGNSCWGNGSQSYFQVKNNDSAAVKLSDITIKFWVNDTTGSPVVPHVPYGGCVTAANGTCVHPISNVTASASRFTGCGPDGQHQANWEITVSTTDSTTLSPGFTWSNLQTGLNLASYAAFSPGSSTWYSSCGTGQPFHTDAHYGVYVGGALVTNNGIAAPDCRAPHGSQPITTYDPPPASPQVGSLPKDKVLTLALSLPLRNLASLQAAIDDAADPASPNYRKWLQPADLEASYLPAASDFSALTTWATSQGLQVSSQPSHMVVGLIGTVAQIEKALFVNMITGRRPDGTIFYAPDRRPTLDFGITVLGISGIDDFIPARVAFSGGRAPAPLAGGLQSNDFRDGYLGAAPSSCASLTGAGQTVGIFTFNVGFNAADIQTYITNTGIVGASLPTVNVAGTPAGKTPAPLADDDGGGSLEASLDIEMVTAMAPGAQVVVFEGNNVDLILDAMVNSPNIAQLTSSWFVGTSATTPQLHTLMAAQGQAFFEASMDFGSYALAAAPQPPKSSCNSAPMPANMTFDMPYITIAGGTELNLNAGTYVSESAWGGSGGGILPAVSIPAWQANANPGNAKLSGVSRNVPDVSMPADGVYIVFSSCDNVGLPGIGGQVAPALCKGNVQCNVVPDGKGGTLSLYSGCKAGGQTQQAGGIGGTSAATPLWAAFLALVNQKNQAHGKIGFPNPTIYGIGRGANYGTSFNDVSDGSASQAACDGTQYTAVAGYDQVTGWGSPKCGLISQLSPDAPKPPTPPIVTVSGNLTQSGNSPVELCGTGSNFTPGSSVTLIMTNVPGLNGTTRDPITLGNFTVGADGKFSYSISASSSPSDVVCTTDQIFSDVTVTATNAQQQIATDTFSGSTFCGNLTVQPGAFGGGCK